MIRPLDLADVEAAAALWEVCDLTRPWNDPRTDARLALTGPDSVILGAFDGERLAGTVMVGFDGHRGWVYYLAVDPARRKQGQGRALMRAAEDWLTARGAPKIQLMLRTDNTQAAGFYVAIGYAEQAVSVWGLRLDAAPLP